MAKVTKTVSIHSQKRFFLIIVISGIVVVSTISILITIIETKEPNKNKDDIEDAKKIIKSGSKITGEIIKNLGFIEFEWGASGGTSTILGYKIERKVGQGEFEVLVANTTSSLTKFTDYDVIPVPIYHYRISAINSDYTGEPSKIIVGSTTSDYFRINFAQDEPDIKIINYEVEKRIGDGKFKSIAIVPPNYLGYIDTVITPGVEYHYRVIGHLENDEKVVSNILQHIEPIDVLK